MSVADFNALMPPIIYLLALAFVFRVLFKMMR